MAWTVVNAHYPALFIGGVPVLPRFRAGHRGRIRASIDLKPPLLVGFFLAGLVIHGGLQGWWIAPVLGSLAETPLFSGATVLTAFNDNALITYLATLVPNLDRGAEVRGRRGRRHRRRADRDRQRPEPRRAGDCSARYFVDGVSPLWLAVSALVPTLVAAAYFILL